MNVPPVTLNWVALTFPFTCSLSAGDVVLIPTFPLLLRIVNLWLIVEPVTVCRVRFGLVGPVAVKVPSVDGTWP